MLELRGVSKSYDRVLALAPTDLAIPAGKTTVLIGPSGCGKSTIIRLMNGLISPDSGQVLFDGVAITSDTVLDIRRKTGYVIQEGGLFPHLTAAKNVSLLATTLDTSAEQVSKKTAELANLTQLPLAALTRYPVELSGGQRQRVSLMRALMLDPDVLLLDEPLGALDPMIRADLQRDLKVIFQELKKTVVMVTHDLAEAAYFADDIVLLREGHIVQRGSLRSLLDNPKDEFTTKFVNAQREPLKALQGANA